MSIIVQRSGNENVDMIQGLHFLTSHFYRHLRDIFLGIFYFANVNREKRRFLIFEIRLNLQASVISNGNLLI